MAIQPASMGAELASSATRLPHLSMAGPARGTARQAPSGTNPPTQLCS